jgi:hypothetical protein
MDERALPFDEEEVAAPRSLDHEALAGAGEEVGDDGVDCDSPAGDHDPGLPGGHEDRAEAARTGGPVELDGDGLLADGAVGADGEDYRGPVREVGARGHAQVGRRLAVVA